MVKVAREKIEKIVFIKKPTGTVETPLSMLRSKTTKKNISSKEEIEFCEENESNFDGGSNREGKLNSVPASKSLTTANFSGTIGEEKCKKLRNRVQEKVRKQLKILAMDRKKQLLD